MDGKKKRNGGIYFPSKQNAKDKWKGKREETAREKKMDGRCVLLGFYRRAKTRERRRKEDVCAGQQWRLLCLIPGDAARTMGRDGPSFSARMQDDGWQSGLAFGKNSAGDETAEMTKEDFVRGRVQQQQPRLGLTFSRKHEMKSLHSWPSLYGGQECSRRNR